MITTQHPRRQPDIPPLLNLLHTHQVRYVLVGSVAAQLYGVEVGTPGDLDITPALDPANLAHLAAALQDMEASLDPEEPPGHWEVQPDGERKWIMDELTPEIRVARHDWSADPSDPATFDHLFLTRYGNFDVVPDLSGDYEHLARRAVEFHAFRITFKVAHVDDLLASLTVPRRSKDRQLVMDLRAYQRRAGKS
jgi:hypothetical protein